MFSLLYKTRWFITGGYWAWLSIELVLINPWAFFGRKVAEMPPMDTSSMTASFILHTGAYGVLGGLLFLSAVNKGLPNVRYWMALAFFHGILAEGVQAFLPNRWPSASDIFSNSLGLIVAYLSCTHFLKSELVAKALNAKALPSKLDRAA
jgi:VanZ family protein